VAALGAVWANVHASFLLLPVVLGVYAAGRPKERRHLALAAGAGLAGTFVNPYGWGLHAHVWSYLRDDGLLAQIGEFQSFNFHAPGAWQIALALLATIAGGTLALVRRDWARGIWMLGVSAMAVRSARYLPVMALAALPLASGVFRATQGGSSKWFQYSARLREHDARFAGYVWMPVLALLAWGYLHLPPVAAGIGFPEDVFPARAAALIPAETRLLAPDLYGGYLIYRFQGTRQVFADGRTDFYGAEFLRDYVRLMQVRPGFEALLERYGFTHALLPKDYSLVAALPRLGWRVRYRDGVAVLLERPMN
jgi:hypothetical protein